MPTLFLGSYLYVKIVCAVLMSDNINILSAAVLIS